jgi:hypothetical protein
MEKWRCKDPESRVNGYGILHKQARKQGIKMSQVKAQKIIQLLDESGIDKVTTLDAVAIMASHGVKISEPSMRNHLQKFDKYLVVSKSKHGNKVYFYIPSNLIARYNQFVVKFNSDSPKRAKARVERLQSTINRKSKLPKKMWGPGQLIGKPGTTELMNKID